MLLEKGDLSALSIRAVSAAVGVTPPSIYLHFADRNELIFDVCDRKWRVITERLNDAVEGESDPLERLKGRGRAYVQWAIQHPEHYRMLLMVRPDQMPPSYAERKVATRRVGFGPLREDLVAAMDSGAIRKGDPDELVFMLFGAVHGLVSLMVTNSDLVPPGPQLVERFIDTVLEGLRAR